MNPNKTETQAPNSPSDSPLPERLERLHDDIQCVLEKLDQLGGSDGPNTLLTREEAAKRLRISTRTLDDMEAAGEIQAVRIRGRVLYAPETLEAYIRRRAGEGSKR